MLKLLKLLPEGQKGYNSIYSLIHAQALQEIYYPLKADKLEKNDKCFKKKKLKSAKFKVSKYR